MSSLFYLALFAGMSGVVFRAFFDDKYNTRHYFWQGLLIGIILGLHAHLWLSGITSSLAAKDCLGIVIFYFMSGWVFSDIWDSIAFIMKKTIRKGRRRHV